jgi:hypothetical protein
VNAYFTAPWRRSATLTRSEPRLLSFPRTSHAVRLFLSCHQNLKAGKEAHVHRHAGCVDGKFTPDFYRYTPDFYRYLAFDRADARTFFLAATQPPSLSDPVHRWNHIVGTISACLTLAITCALTILQTSQPGLVKVGTYQHAQVRLALGQTEVERIVHSSTSSHRYKDG